MHALECKRKRTSLSAEHCTRRAATARSGLVRYQVLVSDHHDAALEMHGVQEY